MPSSPLDPLILNKVHTWLNGPYDEETKKTISSLLEKNPQELIDAFYTDLKFGTGGLRALMGVGTNRLNRYTIRKATQGLANYLLKQTKGKFSVLIGFDSRHHSLEFAQEAAQVLAGNGIHVFLLKELRPTPYISFACRHKKCAAAINITASHNPKEYNGYKVYWSDGGQVVSPHDTGIIEEVEKITDIAAVKMTPLHHPSIEIVGEDLDRAYLDAIRPLQHFPKENKKNGHTLKITYTSLHGTGITIVPKALQDWGFSQIHFVEKQIIPDGDFPTVKFPNPEYKATLELGLQEMQRSGSDILVANDPDADRMGVAILHANTPTILTGNEIAAICTDYLCQVLTHNHQMPSNGAFVTTIVTTELLKKIATSYNKQCFEVLTGFKYIAEKIHLWETEPNGYTFLFGAEESYGYLLGTQARDKDAISGTCLLAEIALHAKLQGQTLVDRLHQIYRDYGIHRDKQVSLDFKPGKEGMEEMLALMRRLRSHLPQTIAEEPVTEVEDYLAGTRSDLKTGKKEHLTLPKSDVLLLRLQDQSRIIIRPSGTEPKVKIYLSAVQHHFSSIEEGIKACDERLEQLQKALRVCIPKMTQESAFGAA